MISRNFVFGLIVAVAASVGFNLVQKYEVDRLKALQVINASINAECNSEFVIKCLNSIREQNLDIVKNQGKIEGIIATLHNYEPDQNSASAIWHSGYYRGLDQTKDMVENNLVPESSLVPVHNTTFTEKSEKDK